MSVNFTTIASVLTVAIGLTYLLLDSYVRRHPLSPALYPVQLPFIFPDEPPIPAVHPSPAVVPLRPAYFTTRDLEELEHLAPKKSDANKWLFGGKLALRLGVEFRTPRSMQGVDIVLVQPPAPKGDFFRLKSQSIKARSSVAAPEAEDWERELAFFRAAIIWYFGAAWLGFWIEECGGTASVIIRANAPENALRNASVNRSGAVPRNRVVVALPGAESAVRQLGLANEVWDIERLLDRMRVRRMDA